MQVAVLGSTGFSGSHICVELLSRGHHVKGISRNPEKLGTHGHYQPISFDIGAATIAEIVEQFQGLDVLVNAYNGPNNYMTFIETTRKILVAAKAAKVGYFVMVGGTGSLALPGTPFATAADSREWWLAYRRAGADSEAATQHMQDRFGPGPMAEGARRYRQARLALEEGKSSDEDKKIVKQVEDQILHGNPWIPDLPVAARATFLMFEGNTSFRWTFVSPSARYRPGPRTGKYDVWIDELPIAKEAERPSEDGNQFEGRLLGISAADLAVAIVDELEQQERVGKHWSAVSEWEEDVPYPTVVTI